MSRHPRFAAYVEACNYPGTVDAPAVERYLAEYLKALGITREIRQLRSNWTMCSEPALKQYALEIIREVLNDRCEQPSDKNLKKFASWCLQSSGWWWWRFDLSWLATTALGATTENVKKWADPILEAFISGCWFLSWIGNTLYWVKKPVVHMETTSNGRRLHNSMGPAIESDVENLYFWHGVLVPDFVITNPTMIDVAMIEAEENAEVRRVLIDRYGVSRYVQDAKSLVVDHCDASHPILGLRDATLYRKDVAGDEPIIMLSMFNSSMESDGSRKQYFVRIDPKAYEGLAAKNCLAAMASSYRMSDGSLVFDSPNDYCPLIET